jgi:hypothetical protein
MSVCKVCGGDMKSETECLYGCVNPNGTGTVEGSGEKQSEPKPEVKTGEVLSDIDYDRLVDAFNLSSERGIEVVEELLADRKQSIIAEAIKELPKEKVLQNPPDIDDLGDMRFNMCLSEVKQILERIGGLK